MCGGGSGAGYSAGMSSPLRGRASLPAAIYSEGQDQPVKGGLAQHSMVPMVPCKHQPWTSSQTPAAVRPQTQACSSAATWAQTSPWPRQLHGPRWQTRLPAITKSLVASRVMDTSPDPGLCRAMDPDPALGSTGNLHGGNLQALSVVHLNTFLISSTQ